MSRARPDVVSANGPPPRPGDFQIEDCLVQPAANRVVRRGTSVSIEPKIMSVLLRLAESPGEVVTKEDLFARAWPETFVTDDVLTRAIGELRKIFEDDPSRPRVIETIRKTGYRLLIAPVEARNSMTPAGAVSSAPARPRPSPRFSPALAVGAALLALITAVLFALRLRTAHPPGPVRIVPVTTFPGNERHPALSPDGTLVAFAWERAGEPTSLYLKLLAAPNPLRLTTSPGSDDEPAWSPDGQKIAFVRRTKAQCAIFSVPSIGGPVQKIADCGSRDAGKLSWAPSGRAIALSVPSPGGTTRIELLDAVDGSRRALTRPPSDSQGDEEPSFSPDGRQVSFLRSLSDGVSDLYTIASAGGEPHRVTFENRAITGADWSPDGRSLIFSSNRAGLFSLWKVSRDGGEPSLLAGGGSKMKHPSTARRVSAVAYENWHYEVNLWTVPLPPAGNAPSQATFAADEWEFDPEFSPDGSRIAYVSTKSGADEIWLTDRRGGAPAQLTSFGGPRLGMPRWSPDGRRIVFTARPGGQADLYTIETSGGALRRLTSTPGDEAAPVWSRDGRFIDFASRRTGSWEVWRMPSSGGSAVRLTFQGGHTAFESPDGKWIYFSRADSPGIWRMPAAGGPATPTPIPLAPNCWADWRLTGKGIYFKVDRDNDAPLVEFLPFDATQARTVARLDHQAWAGFTVAPNDSAIVYGRADRYDCDIRMVENAF
jgi:Tol biopolymer transport system component/DNA-binding winged helix-turn-helix (wHTH) protein